ncbi:MAG: aldo/keto reductase [Actinomycetota bacterium]
MARSQTSMRADTAASLAGQLAIGDDLRVNRFGLGAMRIPGPGVWGPPSDIDEAAHLLHRAVDLGVNFIDTAHAYGPEVSEALIGDTLGPRYDGVVVATKSGLQRLGPNLWYPDCRPETLRADCERSLTLLHADTIELFQLHTVDPNVPLEDSLGALVGLMEEGKVRRIGVCNVDEAQLALAWEVAPIVTVQNRYSLGHRASDGVVDACQRDGLAFMPWYPLEAGHLLSHPVLGAVARAHGATPAQVALAWLLRRSPATLLIPGTASIQHLVENAGCTEVTLTDVEFDRLTALAS